LYIILQFELKQL